MWNKIWKGKQHKQLKTKYKMHPCKSIPDKYYNLFILRKIKRKQKKVQHTHTEKKGGILADLYLDDYLLL